VFSSLRRGLPGNRVVIRQVVHAADPNALMLVGAVDNANAQGLNGATGTVIIGEHGSPSARYSGDLGPLQAFRGAAFMGASTNLRRGMNTALPATSPVTAASVADAPTILEPLLWGMRP
jgi:hypothetical protein